MDSTLATNADLSGPGPDAILAVGFLARYREPTRGHYAMVLKQWFTWCREHGVRPTEITRAHIELWARELEEVGGLKLSTISGKLGVVSGLYKFMVIDGYRPDNPAAYLKRPSVPRVSTTNGLTRPELLKMLDLAQQSSPQEHAMLCILGLNGLRVGELCAIQIEDIGREAGYHTVRIIREKSRQPASIPLAPRTSWAVEQTMWGRTFGPLFLLRGEKPMDRRGVDRVVKRFAKKAGVTKRVSPHSMRHTFVTLSLDAGCSVRQVQNSVGHADARMVSYYDRAKDSLQTNSTHMMSAFLET